MGWGQGDQFSIGRQSLKPHGKTTKLLYQHIYDSTWHLGFNDSITKCLLTNTGQCIIDGRGCYKFWKTWDHLVIPIHLLHNTVYVYVGGLITNCRQGFSYQKYMENGFGPMRFMLSKGLTCKKYSKTYESLNEGVHLNLIFNVHTINTNTYIII